jgi:hypothetical protein
VNPEFAPGLEEHEASPETRIEQTIKDGEAYRSYVDFVSGTSESFDMKNIDVSEETRTMLENIVTSAEGHFQEQKAVFEKNEGPMATMEQIARMKDLTKEDLDLKRVTVEQPRDGVAIFSIPTKSWERLGLRGAQAAAALDRRLGASSILLQKDDSVNAEDIARYREENISHEMHHMVWNFARRDGKLVNTEQNPAFRDQFDVFQDELIARVTSGGWVGGYTKHVWVGESREGHDDLDVNAAVISLNEWFRETVVPTLVSRGVDNTALISPSLGATSFATLRARVENVLQDVETMPIIKKEVPHTDWDYI